MRIAASADYLAIDLDADRSRRLVAALGPAGRLTALLDGEDAAEAAALIFDMDAPEARASAVLARARQVAPLVQVVFLGSQAALTRVRQGLLLVGGLRDQWTFLIAEREDGWPALLAEAQERTAARRAIGRARATPAGSTTLAAARPPVATPLANLLAHISEAVLQLDLQRRVTYANAAAQATYGADATRLGGELAALLAPVARPLLAAALDDVAREGVGVVVEADHLRADRRSFPAESSLGPVKDWRGQLVGISVLVRDLTPRREAERAERLAIAHDLALAHAATLEAEVAARTQELQVALEEVSRANEKLLLADVHKDEFLSVISHELRTPLNFITGFASTVDDEVLGPLNVAQHDAMQKILTGADRMLGLVDDLLDFARMQAGTFRLAPEAVDYAALVDGVLASLTVLAERKGLALVADVDVAGPVMLDDLRIAQVVTNLVGNAIKFTERGTIRVTARLGAEGLLTEVEDTGVGVAAADVERLFMRFQQLDMSATRKAGGTGLGLAISKAIVEAHGGTIGVRSAPGEGSVFWFSLPIPT